MPASITMGNASSALAALVQAIDRGESVIDLAALTHSDSSAVAVVLAATRYAQQAGKAVRFSGVPPSMASLAKLYGVEGFLSDRAAVATT